MGQLTKLIIVNPPNPAGYVSNKDSMGGFGQLYPIGAPPFPALDIPYLAGAATARGIDVEVIEAGACLMSTADVVEALRAQPALGQCLVMVRTSLPTIDADLQCCSDIKRSVLPGSLGLYGAAVTALLTRIESEQSLDVIVLGEPDGPVVELMSGAPPEAVPGLMFRGPAGWIRNTERPLQRDLDAIPFPRWDLLPYQRYTIPRSSASGQLRFLPLLSSRGCPFGCSYCPYPVGQGLKWRFRSPGNVVDEMEHLVKDLGVEHILFRDPMFSMQQKRVVDICEEIVRRGLKVSWKCETRMDCLDEATIAAMARAGCVGVNFGVESVDPEIQKGVHRKPILMSEFLEKVALCRKYDISTFAFFVVGLPGDTVDTILDSIEFAVRIQASWTQFTVATPFVGTPMHDWAVNLGVIQPDFYRIVNAHTLSLGNEHIEGGHITELHHFARALQEGLLNRHGVLKNDRRRTPGYVMAKRGVDWLAHAVALGAVRLGRPYFKWRIPSGPNPTLPHRVPDGTVVGAGGQGPA